jgi:pyridoxal phosphate enzyme (YggS family)
MRAFFRGLATNVRALQSACAVSRPQPTIDSDSQAVAAQLAAVRARIAAAAKAAGRDPAAVTLVAVTKTQSAERVAAALAGGQRVFGENRVQEAAAKWPALKPVWPQAELHLIGPLQTNKARDAVALFDVIETVDRPKLAQVLATEMARSGRRPGCYIQINTGEEPQKAGALPAAADEFIRFCRDDMKLPVVGLMCIPPADDEPSLHFALLAEMARRHGIETLSMGMSADYEIAIKLGATHVRIGTAIFGERHPAPPA